MNKRIKILLAIDGIFMLAGGLFGPLYALFVTQVGGSILDAGLAAAAFSITFGVITLGLGAAEEKTHRLKEAVILGYSVIAIGIAGYSFVSNPFELAMVQVLLGIGYAIEAPAFDAFFSKSIKKKASGALDWASWEGMAGIVGGTAAVLGSVIVTITSFKTLFSIMFVIAILGLITAIFTVKNFKNPRSKRVKDIKR
ncbi:MAG: MFS transporter [Candidatus Diapherotrites archaeon]|nr:MFS transporter [Candidatus Diapherotrites archaeon]